jgi:hypothetical protein
MKLEAARLALHNATRDLLVPLTRDEWEEALRRWRAAHQAFLVALRAPREAGVDPRASGTPAGSQVQGEPGGDLLAA